MKFDLHMHTTISDGSATPEVMREILKSRDEISTVTDHDAPSFHLPDDTGCAFTGIEITSHVQFDGQTHLVEYLLYGFSKEDIPNLRFDLIKKQGLSLPELAEHIKPTRERGAKLFMAHPAYYYLHSNRLMKESLPYVDGIECLHPSATVKMAEDLILYCKENNKLASGGGDTHSMTCYKGTPYLHPADKYPEVFSWIHDMKEKTAQQASSD